MKNTVVLIIFTLGVNLLLNEAAALLTEGVIGGVVGDPSAFKYQVSIQGDGEHGCNGGILSDELVVAVTHCIVDYGAIQFYQKRFEVVVTANVLLPNEAIASAPVEKVYLPKTFDLDSYVGRSNSKLNVDFLIFKLEQGLGIDRNPLLQSLQLPDNSLFDPNASYVIAGHGIHAQSSNGEFLPSDGQLRYAEVDIVPNHDCSSIYNFKIPSHFMCAKVKQIPGMYRGTCKGDNGSPLVQDGRFIVGVLVLSAERCKESLYPSVYMRISHYSQFVENAKNENTLDMRVFALTKNAQSEYAFIEETASTSTVCCIA